MTPVELVIYKLYNDTFVQSWADTRIYDRDPNRTGPEATPDAFDENNMMTMKPSLAVISSVSTQSPSIGAPAGAAHDYVDIRIFHTRTSDSRNEISKMILYLRTLFNQAPLFDSDNQFRGYAEWSDDYGPDFSTQFADTMVGESHVYIVSMF